MATGCHEHLDLPGALADRFGDRQDDRGLAPRALYRRNAHPL